MIIENIFELVVVFFMDKKLIMIVNFCENFNK